MIGSSEGQGRVTPFPAICPPGPVGMQSRRLGR
jgi:hypothetical protein